MRNKFVSTILGSCIFAAALATVANAQPAARITESVSDLDTVSLPNTRPPWAQPSADQGPADAGTLFDSILLLLEPSADQKSALDDLLDRLHDPDAPTFHQWLTPQEFGSRFGPSDGDLNAITGWLQSHGAQVGEIGAGRQWIRFSATASQVQALFGSEIHAYQVNGKSYLANASDLSLPRALNGVVRGVLSLNNFEKPPMHSPGFLVGRTDGGPLVPVAALDTSGAGLAIDQSADLTTGGGSHFLSPADFQRIYGISPLLQQATDGSGVQVAIVGRSDIQLSDTETFRQIFGLPPNDPEVIVNGVDPGFTPDELEADLDVEWSGAAAPMAAIKLVTSATTASTDGVDLSAAYIVDHRVAPIMSTSFGLCEAFLGPGGNAFYNSLWRQAAAEGITALVSAGDNGVAGCDAPVSILPPRYGRNVNGLASTPYNVAVGGTELNENGQDATYWSDVNQPDQSSVIGYIPETAWNESCDPRLDPARCNGYVLFAGSGGPSSCSNVTWTIVGGQIQITCLGGYSKPSWQIGANVPVDGVRDLPDVSLTAAGGHDGYLVCVEGACQTTVVNGQPQLASAVVVGGTSASSPTMAGILALVEQVHGQFQGQANYNLYRLAATEDPSQCDSSLLNDPTQTSSCSFYDTTQGNNSVPFVPGFEAAPGYDMATGLGSVNAANLVRDWLQGRKLETKTTLAATVRTAQHGQPIILDVRVRSRRRLGAPTGAVALRAGEGDFVTSVLLSDGSFSGPVNDLPGGKYHLVAHYGGNGMFGPSDSNPVPLVITPEDSRISVQPYNVNLIGFWIPTTGGVFYGTPVALQIDVHGLSGVGAATGTVTIYDGATRLGSVSLSGGTAWVPLNQFLVSSLEVGVHAFSVSYSGDRSFNGVATPQPAAVTIVKAFVNFARVFGDATSVTAGTPVLLHMVVLAPGSAVPSGTVQLYDNLMPIDAPVALSTTVAKGAVQADVTVILAPGSHSFRIGYSGDVHYNPITPPSFRTPSFIVTAGPSTGIPTAIQIIEASPAITVGQSEAYVVTVVSSASGGPVPTGTVTLRGPSGSSIAGPYPLTSGVAKFMVAWSRYFNVGTSRLVAQYSGDGIYSAGISSEILTTVDPATPAVSLTAPSAIVRSGSLGELTVTVQPTITDANIRLPFGLVQFLDSIDGQVPQPLGAPHPLTQGNGNFTTFVLATTLPEGTNVITAQYLGGGEWGPAMSNPVKVVVRRGPRHHETDDGGQ